MFFKKRRSSRHSDLNRTVQALEAEIQALENSLKQKHASPQKTGVKQTLPPPERRKTYRQERALHVAMARHGRTSNIRRELKENFFLLLLLIVANVTSTLWIIRLLERS